MFKIKDETKRRVAEETKREVKDNCLSLARRLQAKADEKRAAGDVDGADFFAELAEEQRQRNLANYDQAE